MKTACHFRYPWLNFNLSGWRHVEDMWISFDVDSGGIQVFSCPLHLVLATEPILLQLASDLEHIVWNRAINIEQKSRLDETEFNLQVKHPDMILPEYVDGKHGEFFGEFWFGCDIWDAAFCEDVVNVIKGKSGRIDVERYNQWLKVKYPVEFRDEI